MKYIGITDFTNAGEVLSMLAVFNTHKPAWWQGLLHVGVMMSHQTLNGVSTKWDNTWPKKEDIPKIFLQNKDLLNVIHYSDYKGIDIFQSLKRVHALGGENLHAIQLDMIWPSPEEIKKFQRAESEVGIILQVNRKCLELTGNDDSQLLKKLKEYGSSINVVLLDMSAGEGIPLEPEFLLPKIEILSEHLPDLDIAVAGGLGPKTMHLVKPIWQNFPEVSTDAQSQLRQSGSAVDPIDWKLAGEYLVSNFDLIKQQKQ